MASDFGLQSFGNKVCIQVLREIDNRLHFEQIKQRPVTASRPLFLLVYFLIKTFTQMDHTFRAWRHRTRKCRRGRA